MDKVGTIPGKESIELRREQQPRTASGSAKPAPLKGILKRTLGYNGREILTFDKENDNDTQNTRRKIGTDHSSYDVGNTPLREMV